jgi:hypothetical protein
MSDPKDGGPVDIKYGWLEPFSTYSEGIIGNSHCIVIGNETGTITKKATRHSDGSIELNTLYSNEHVYNADHGDKTNRFTGARGGIAPQPKEKT